MSCRLLVNTQELQTEEPVHTVNCANQNASQNNENRLEKFRRIDLKKGLLKRLFTKRKKQLRSFYSRYLFRRPFTKGVYSERKEFALKQPLLRLHIPQKQTFFFIQERFDKLICSINTIIKCGI